MNEVLAAIEALVADDQAELWSMEAGAKRLRGRAKLMQQRLDDVYRLAHGFNTDHSCYHVHEDWRVLAHSSQDGESK